jgi:hypothetical protein
VPTDKLGEKDPTTGQNPHIETTPINTVSATVELPDIFANMLSTLQADKLEIMASVKESVKEENEKSEKEFGLSVKEGSEGSL